MSGQPIDVQIFGRTFRVQCPHKQEEALMQAVEDLNTRLHTLKSKTNINNSEQIAFITALNICHELAQEKLKIQDYAKNIEKHIQILQKTIEEALLKHEQISDRSNNQFE
ncbi:cell division protein ZapA [Blochmannia endosymbiont of Polyrhachis (Hedomyrma) turneri]|uniref:cell division protein ZapA n=1 Tax=Blochmannia endosymbiont of Polyrhachis (Hedomyrma) turneri TaxID=1505596 RepID=UPI00061A8570|nr:cell division protein ZapA [Blochmannia endosymbiont of Polyrhachis (Hedomyrma) turneri]AKC59829.1 Cell division protein ZapA [Blochmannia endosymbiont of Polyrhachis (Hedomyrma) turneri]